MPRLANIARKVLACRACPDLNVPGSTEAAPCYGNSHSSIMLVGQSNHAWNPETPNRQIPFVNSSKRAHAGSILFPALEEAGIPFRRVCTTNVVKCHPPGNRRCTATEVESCRQWLSMEIMTVRPRCIVCLGNDAGEALNVPTKYRVTKSTFTSPLGQTWSFYGTLVPHPAYLLRMADGDPVRAEAETKRFFEYFKWLAKEFA